MEMAHHAQARFELMIKLHHAAALALVPVSVAMSFSLQSGRPVILIRRRYNQGEIAEREISAMRTAVIRNKQIVVADHPSPSRGAPK
jgi:hypothetical protein